MYSFGIQSRFRTAKPRLSSVLVKENLLRLYAGFQRTSSDKVPHFFQTFPEEIYLFQDINFLVFLIFFNQQDQILSDFACMVTVHQKVNNDFLGYLLNIDEMLTWRNGSITLDIR